MCTCNNISYFIASEYSGNVNISQPSTFTQYDSQQNDYVYIETDQYCHDRFLFKFFLKFSDVFSLHKKIFKPLTQG